MTAENTFQYIEHIAMALGAYDRGLPESTILAVPGYGGIDSNAFEDFALDAVVTPVGSIAKSAIRTRCNPTSILCTGGHLTVQDLGQFDLADRPYAVEAWCHDFGVTEGHIVLALHNSSTDGYLAFGVNGSGILQLEVNANGVFYQVQGDEIISDHWIHLGVVCASDSLQLFTQGNRVKNQAAVIQDIGSFDTCIIGAAIYPFGGLGEQWSGLLRDVMMRAGVGSADRLQGDRYAIPNAPFMYFTGGVNMRGSQLPTEYYPEGYVPRDPQLFDGILSASHDSGVTLFPGAPLCSDGSGAYLPADSTNEANARVVGMLASAQTNVPGSTIKIATTRRTQGFWGFAITDGAGGLGSITSGVDYYVCDEPGKWFDAPPPVGQWSARGARALDNRTMRLTFDRPSLVPV